MRQNQQLQNIESALQLVDWQNLQPNYPNQFDLLPRHLNAQHIFELGTMATDLAFKSRLISGDLSFGTLSKIGGGESKKSFRLQTELGSMVVHALPFAAPERQPTDIESPYLTKVADKLYEFSDLRYYLTAPWTEQSSIRLQEDGGTRVSSLGIGLSYWHARHVLHTAGIHLKGADLEKATVEMQQLRHHLRKSGYPLPLIIDVPVIDRR